jgi:hypothetical protein
MMKEKMTEAPFLTNLTKITKLIDLDGKIKAEIRRLESVGPTERQISNRCYSSHAVG